MATITISVTNSSIMPNAQKIYTISDSDLQALLTWAGSTFAAQLPVNPTNAQVLLAWLQGTLIGPTIGNVQNSQRTVPPPISIA